MAHKKYTVPICKDQSGDDEIFISNQKRSTHKNGLWLRELKSKIASLNLISSQSRKHKRTPLSL